MSPKLAMGYCTARSHYMITTAQYYSFSLLLEKAGNKSSEEGGMKQAPGQLAMAMDEQWVIACQGWPGRPANPGTSSQHNRPWEDLPCLEVQSDRQNGCDSLAGQKQIIIHKFKSHSNPTVGTIVSSRTVQEWWMQQAAFERCTTLLDLLPSSSLTCLSVLP